MNHQLSWMNHQLSWMNHQLSWIESSARTGVTIFGATGIFLRKKKKKRFFPGFRETSKYLLNFRCLGRCVFGSPNILMAGVEGTFPPMPPLWGNYKPHHYPWKKSPKVDYFLGETTWVHYLQSSQIQRMPGKTCVHDILNRKKISTWGTIWNLTATWQHEYEPTHMSPQNRNNLQMVSIYVS